MVRVVPKRVKPPHVRETVPQATYGQYFPSRSLQFNLQYRKTLVE